MKLVIGGYAQGKLVYVLAKPDICSEQVWEGVPVKEEWEEKNLKGKSGILVVNHFHLWIRRRLLEGGSPEEEVTDFLDACGDCVIISDEIGNGIVPADPFERAYRERAGRLLTELAKRAKEVERVICGIGQKIK